MTLEQSWQNYRSMVNDKLAIFSINLEILKKFPSETSHKVIQFQFSYQADENQLPAPEAYQDLMEQVFKVWTQLCALPNTLYAGHVLSAGKAQLYFYCEYVEPFLDVLQQFDNIEKINIQDDPNWDIYFDFLLPSPLEMKINATEEVLDLLVQNGRDLADTYLIEHGFHFEDENNMFRFMEHVNLQNMDFISMQYSNTPVIIDDEIPFYVVKLEQELSLDSADIFKYVEEFENIASQFNGEYVGWECDSLHNKEQLN
ncbi:TIGR01619 family protein [Pasteurella oralis]|uniref:TIGR01619 family protein n=1 Tax=Pasteurella oralis TaxID=1071947 RepID=UPI000C7C1F3C|nr:TIGR01619 family protein [Pasteurella oralis]